MIRLTAKGTSARSQIYSKLTCLLGIITLFTSYKVDAICFNTFNINPYCKLSPINIESSKVISTNTSTPLTFIYQLINFANVTNTGAAIELYTNEFFDFSSVTGGVLCDKIYKINRNRIYISKNVSCRCANTIDGEGFPIEVTGIYYNIQYGTFKNALKFPDGIAMFSFPIKVGSKLNLRFTQFQNILTSGKISEPGSSTETLSLFAYQWYNNIPLTQEYYAFIGSYYEPESKKQISGATYVIIEPPLGSISYEQYAAFKNVMGQNNEPIATVTPIYPQGSRKVYKAKGIKAIGLPI